jgi:hypothetical protein
MKMAICTILLALPGFALANVCDSDFSEKSALRAAQTLEIINGGGRPLSTDIYSYSSQQRKWTVVFSYSGIQNIWTVATSEDGCRVEGAWLWGDRRI